MSIRRSEHLWRNLFQPFLRVFPHPARELGPTRPGMDLGRPFPADPPAVVNSPVEVTVNGKPAEIIGAVGYPGSVDGYQVNFRVPSDASPGMDTIQLSAAWIAGPEVRIMVQ